MMTIEQSREVRILLDNKSSQLDVLTSAASLARQMKVRLQGMFIEEENLLRAAELSISREISFWSGQERQMSGAEMQRTLRAHALNKKKELEKIAQKENIECSFEVIRGERMPWIMESDKTSDILFIDGRKVSSKSYQGLKYCSFDKAPLKLLYSGSAASQSALITAAQLASLSKRPLLILKMVDTANIELALTEQINSLLNEYPDVTVNVESANDVQLLASLHKLQAHMLIYPGDIDWADEDKHLVKLLQRVHCPLVLIR